jgi:hypothetical protein
VASSVVRATTCRGNLVRACSDKFGPSRELDAGRSEAHPDPTSRTGANHWVGGPAGGGTRNG